MKIGSNYNKDNLRDWDINTFNIYVGAMNVELFGIQFNWMDRWLHVGILGLWFEVGR